MGDERSSRSYDVELAQNGHAADEARPSEPAETSGDNRRIRGKLHQRLHANPALSLTTKVVVTGLGALVLGAGLVMMVTPGPGIVGIVLGLAILATEWEWAERWLVAARKKAREAKEKAAAMDPRVRRRRILVGGLVVLVVLVAVICYVAAFGWPSPAMDGWDWVQSLAGWVPDLPGM